MVDVQEPCHGGAPSSAKAVVAARNELDVPAIAEILKLLADFGSDVLIARIETAQMALERVDFVESEVSLAERLNALHHIEQPAARFE